MRVCRYRHFGQVSDHLTSLIHSRLLSVSTTPPLPRSKCEPEGTSLVLRSPLTPPSLQTRAATHDTPSLATNASQGASSFVLCDYGHWNPLPCFKCELRGLFFCSMRLRPPEPPPLLQTRVEGSFLSFYVTTASSTPSLASNVSRGVSSFVLCDYGQCYPLPRSKREQRGLHLG